MLLVHGGDKVCEVGEGLLRGEVDQILHAEVRCGVAVAVESEVEHV